MFSLMLKGVVNHKSEFYTLLCISFLISNPMQNINLCQVHYTVIKNRAKSFINQDFKDIIEDRCCFKLRWKLHIIMITIYALYASITTVKLREDFFFLNCGFVWKRRTISLLAISRWKASRRISLIHTSLKRDLTYVLDRLKWTKESPERMNSGCMWKMIIIPLGNESLQNTVSK